MGHQENLTHARSEGVEILQVYVHLIQREFIDMLFRAVNVKIASDSFHMLSLFDE
jgi:hypothetical protein